MPKLSVTDVRLLSILQEEGDITNVELADRVGMAPSPCLRKVKGLRDSGYITRTVALLDRRKLGFAIVAYVEVRVPQVANVAIVDSFRKAVMREPAIVGCYITSGQFDFLLKVIVPGVDEYSSFLTNILLRLPGVRDTNTTFVLEVVKDSTSLPLASRPSD